MSEKLMETNPIKEEPKTYVINCSIHDTFFVEIKENEIQFGSNIEKARQFPNMASAEEMLLRIKQRVPEEDRPTYSVVDYIEPDKPVNYRYYIEESDYLAVDLSRVIAINSFKDELVNRLYVTLDSGDMLDLDFRDHSDLYNQYLKYKELL